MRAAEGKVVISRPRGYCLLYCTRAPSKSPRTQPSCRLDCWLDRAAAASRGKASAATTRSRKLTFAALAETSSGPQVRGARSAGGAAVSTHSVISDTAPASISCSVHDLSLSPPLLTSVTMRFVCCWIWIPTVAGARDAPSAYLPPHAALQESTRGTTPSRVLWGHGSLAPMAAQPNSKPKACAVPRWFLTAGVAG